MAKYQHFKLQSGRKSAASDARPEEKRPADHSKDHQDRQPAGLQPWACQRKDCSPSCAALVVGMMAVLRVAPWRCWCISDSDFGQRPLTGGPARWTNS
jgi:hypothetical protein